MRETINILQKDFLRIKLFDIGNNCILHLPFHCCKPLTGKSIQGEISPGKSEPSLTAQELLPKTGEGTTPSVDQGPSPGPVSSAEQGPAPVTEQGSPPLTEEPQTVQTPFSPSRSAVITPRSHLVTFSPSVACNYPTHCVGLGLTATITVAFCF